MTAAKSEIGPAKHLDMDALLARLKGALGRGDSATKSRAQRRSRIKSLAYTKSRAVACVDP